MRVVTPVRCLDLGRREVDELAVEALLVERAHPLASLDLEVFPVIGALRAQECAFEHF